MSQLEYFWAFCPSLFRQLMPLRMEKHLKDCGWCLWGGNKGRCSVCLQFVLMNTGFRVKLWNLIVFQQYFPYSLSYCQPKGIIKRNEHKCWGHLKNIPITVYTFHCKGQRGQNVSRLSKTIYMQTLVSSHNKN